MIKTLVAPVTDDSELGEVGPIDTVPITTQVARETQLA